MRSPMISLWMSCGAFVGVDGFEIVHVAHDAVIVDDAVRAENVAALRAVSRAIPRCSFSAWRCARDRRGPRPSGGRRAARAVGLCDFGDHPGEFVLYQLVRGDGLVRELFARLGILQRGVVAGHGRADGAPADAVAGLIQAAERPFSPSMPGSIFSAGISQSSEQSRSDRSAQRPFAVDVPGFESGRALFHQKAANFVVFGLAQTTATSAMEPLVIHIFSPFRIYWLPLLHRAREHAAGIRAELRFGEAKAADGFALLQQRQPLIFLRVACRRCRSGTSPARFAR